LRAFATGLLAAVVATPCTAPFMGAAVGFTLTAPPAMALLVFAALGVGMAMPYWILGARPSLLDRLPRPGRWMLLLRQGLAFPMYAAALWLLSVLGAQRGIDAVLQVGIAGVLLAAAAWWWGQPTPGWLRRLPSVALLVGALVLAWPSDPGRTPAGVAGVGGTRDAAGAGGTGGVAQGSGPQWQTWSPAALAGARAEGRPVFVEFTAAWCISCQVNHRWVLESERLRAAFLTANVALLRADWTQQDPQITQALAEHGRNGVPLYLVYRAGADSARVLPELLTVNSVLRAIGLE
jgi:thiol:disulfide interchange protein DsbD